VGLFVVGFLVSCVGFVLFSYGRKLKRPPQLLSGIVLLVVPYFVPNVAWLLGATVLTLFLTWVWLMKENQV
jgi:hypothetical protein